MVSASASAAMMIMASWILAVASGWRPIACMAPLPMPPSPMPEPMAASPIPTGRPHPSAEWKSIVILLAGLVGVLRLRVAFRLIPVVIVRQHEEEVDRAENREHQRLQRAGEQRQEQERQLERQPERQVGEAHHGDAERGERHQQHVLAEDVSEQP